MVRCVGRVLWAIRSPTDEQHPKVFDERFGIEVAPNCSRRMAGEWIEASRSPLLKPVVPRAQTHAEGFDSGCLGCKNCVAL